MALRLPARRGPTTVTAMAMKDLNYSAPVCLVWLEEHQSREDAKRVVGAIDEEEAALKFVELDGDGRADGIYEDGETVIVEDPCGRRFRVRLHIAMEPQTYVDEVEALDASIDGGG